MGKPAPGGGTWIRPKRKWAPKGRARRPRYIPIEVSHSAAQFGATSTLRAGPPIEEFARAIDWRSGETMPLGRQRTMAYVETSNERLIDLLHPGPAEAIRRSRILLMALEEEMGPEPADITPLASKALADDMKQLEWIAEAAYRRLTRRRPSVTLLTRWTMQLALRTSHTVGLALLTTTTWPMTWVRNNAKGAGIGRGRPKLVHQIAILAWRIEQARWPSPNYGLAKWIERRLSQSDE